MSALFFALGAVARINAAMWRFRINFIPINVAVLGGLAVGGIATLSSTLEILRNSSMPLPMTIEQIRDSPDVVQNYVAISGVAIPVALYEHRTNGPKRDDAPPDKSWFPLADRQSKRIVLVQMDGNLAQGQPHETTITGMLRTMNGELRRRVLAAQNDTFGGVSVETRYMLVADERPGDLGTMATLTGIIFGIVGLFTIATLMRNTIFQPTGRTLSTAPTAGEEILRVGTTGTFVLSEAGKTFRKRFVNIPAVLFQQESGEIALVSNIDASSRFMGFTTSKRAGIWALPVAAGSVRQFQIGFLYWGLSRHHAFRFTYTDAFDRAQREAIIVGENEEMIGAAVRLLGRAAG